MVFCAHFQRNSVTYRSKKCSAKTLCTDMRSTRDVQHILYQVYCSADKKTATFPDLQTGQFDCHHNNPDFLAVQTQDAPSKRDFETRINYLRQPFYHFLLATVVRMNLNRLTIR